MSNDVERARVELRVLYSKLDEELARRPALFCGKSGRCCRFREAGHELFLTRLEYEEMVRCGGAAAGPANVCPWLVEGLCANRGGRALACRTYFCSDEQEAAEVTERWHREVRRLHERNGIPYDYRSLREHLGDASSGREP